jgi:hypothetical protein
MKARRLFLFQGVDEMTNIMLNTQLYQKMYAKQEQHKTYLLILTPA